MAARRVPDGGDYSRGVVPRRLDDEKEKEVPCHKPGDHEYDESRVAARGEAKVAEHLGELEVSMSERRRRTAKREHTGRKMSQRSMSIITRHPTRVKW